MSSLDRLALRIHGLKVSIIHDLYGGSLDTERYNLAHKLERQYINAVTTKKKADQTND